MFAHNPAMYASPFHAMPYGPGPSSIEEDGGFGFFRPAHHHHFSPHHPATIPSSLWKPQGLPRLPSADLFSAPPPQSLSSTRRRQSQHFWGDQAPAPTYQPLPTSTEILLQQTLSPRHYIQSLPPLPPPLPDPVSIPSYAHSFAEYSPPHVAPKSPPNDATGRVGDIFAERYRLIRYLGTGHSASVWLVYDYECDNFKAMKIQKAMYRAAAFEEIAILRQIRDRDPSNSRCVCFLTDDFDIHGQEVVMVFQEFGYDLYQLIKKHRPRGVPIPIVKKVARQILVALDYLHRKLGLIHTDLKPENIIVCQSLAEALTEQDLAVFSSQRRQKIQEKIRAAERQVAESGRLSVATVGSSIHSGSNHSSGAFSDDAVSDESVDTSFEKADHQNQLSIKLIDFGNARWVTEHPNYFAQTRHYRSPEVIVGNRYDTAIDIWSVACLIFEMLCGSYLFDPQPQGENYIDRARDHLARMVELLQSSPELPSCLCSQSNDFVSASQRRVRGVEQYRYRDLKTILTENYRFCEDKANDIASFLLPMLTMDPQKRATATQMLHHPWLHPSPDDWYPFRQDGSGECTPHSRR